MLGRALADRPSLTGVVRASPEGVGILAGGFASPRRSRRSGIAGPSLADVAIENPGLPVAAACAARRSCRNLSAPSDPSIAFPYPKTRFGRIVVQVVDRSAGFPPFPSSPCGMDAVTTRESHQAQRHPCTCG
jgi:hypothetical protein